MKRERERERGKSLLPGPTYIIEDPRPERPTTPSSLGRRSLGAVLSLRCVVERGAGSTPGTLRKNDALEKRKK